MTARGEARIYCLGAIYPQLQVRANAIAPAYSEGLRAMPPMEWITHKLSKLLFIIFLRHVSSECC